MFHPRSGKKKIEEIARALETAAALTPVADPQGFWRSGAAREPHWAEGVRLAEKLRNGLTSKSFALSEAESAAVVHALEYALVNGCDHRSGGWDEALEKLHNEAAKQFVSTFGHSCYANE
jgi:hypothetical protein